MNTEEQSGRERISKKQRRIERKEQRGTEKIHNKYIKKPYRIASK